jgi:predicted unusual protein kinase regulating ubiquinone biosynthesis (AarF/ABC1/UbiB family)
VTWWWQVTPGGFDNGDIDEVITRVANEILDELDYRKEAVGCALPPSHDPHMTLT